MGKTVVRQRKEDLRGMPAARGFRCKWPHTKARAELWEPVVPIEIRDGQFVRSPSSPSLQKRVNGRFCPRLDQCLYRRRLDVVVVSLIDAVLKGDLMVQPDIMYIARDRLGVIQHCVMGAPDLVAKGVWPAKCKRDRFEERRGKECRIVNPGDEQIQIRTQSEDFFALVGHNTRRQFGPSTLLSRTKVQVDQMLSPSLTL